MPNTAHAFHGSAVAAVQLQPEVLLPVHAQVASLPAFPPAIAPLRRTPSSLPSLPALQPAPAVAMPDPAVAAAEQERLMIEHLPVVRYVARQIHERLPQHVDLDELISAGTLGLIDASRKFDPTKNVQFRSYAQFRIRGAILDSLRTLDWGPRELRRKGRMVQEATRTLSSRLGRPPLETEIALELAMELGEYQQLLGELKGLEISTLNAERSEEGGEEELAFVPGKETDCPLFQLLEGEARQRLAKAVSQLPERERLVMTLYYYEERTMKEIGMVLGVVESRVSQIHASAVGHLRGLLVDLAGKGARSTAKTRKRQRGAA